MVSPAESAVLIPATLPEPVRLALNDYCASAREAFGERLRAIVLYGSAAEGRLRATSDVNLLVVLDAFDRQRVDPMREAARMAHAAVRLDVLYLLATELPMAADAFAVKFQDMLARRLVLLGTDPLATLTIAPEKVRQRLRQVLLNTQLRLRSAYVTRSLRDEQLAFVIADAAAPIRSSAAAILALDGRASASPKAALQTLCTEIGGDWDEVLAGFSDARADARLAPGAAAPLLFRLLALCTALRERADRSVRAV